MSTFRTLSAADIEQVRRVARADAVDDLQAIAAGIENSNWFLTLATGGGRFPCVLTLVEGVPEDELPFFIALTDVLAEADLPVPMALPLAGGQRQFLLQERPALLVPRLPGTHVGRVTPALCRAVGATLAQLHAAATRCPLDRERPDHRWWPTAFAWLAPALDRATHEALAAALLDASATFSRAHRLPHGIIHGDLFRDNVLVRGEEVSGVLDFFHATRDLLAWDIAIALNDWAVEAGTPDPALAAAFVDGYGSERLLTANELAMLPALRRAAAARFWLSRGMAAARQDQPAGGGLVSHKDPAAMQALWERLAAAGD